jgi:hypothetical protein
MAAYAFPTSAELQQIAQDKLPNLTQNRPIFDIFPMRAVNDALLIWEQLDNFKGLQAVRGLNGQPPRVQPVGLKQYQMQPGVYGEFVPIDELQMVVRRAPGSFATTVDLTDMVLEKQDQLLGRRLDRIEQIGWTLLATGVFSVAASHGSILHTDQFPVQTYTAVNAWSNFAASAPLADLSAVQLLSRGHSVDFGARAVAYMNRGTFNNLRSNTNPSDIYGRRSAGLGTYNNLQGINQLLTGDDLPGVVVYDLGYFNEAGTFVPYIPANTVIVVGIRPAGQTVGEYRMTRNANNPDMAPGPYMRVIDLGEMQVPRNIEVHDGHSGGPVLYYPSAIVVMNV